MPQQTATAGGRRTARTRGRETGENRSSDRRFAELYRANYGRLVQYGQRRVPAHEVEDLVADVFLAAWRRIDDAPDGPAVLPWLYRIAHHTTGNHWRGRDRRRRLIHKLSSLIPGVAQGPAEDDGPGDDRVDAILEVAAGLSPDDQEILRLAHWEQLSVAEIGLVLDLSPNAAKQRLRRARGRLRRRSSHLSCRPGSIDRSEVEGVDR